MFNLGRLISQNIVTKIQTEKLTNNSHKQLGNYNPVKNIWNKIEKFSKIGQGNKSLISTFACFLTDMDKV